MSRAPPRRYENWPQLLTAAIAERADRPFAFGRHDCCLAACALVKAMTGTDLARGLRGYRSAKGARGKLDAGGGVVGLVNAVAERFAVEPVAPAFAQRGDVVVVRAPVGLDGEEGDALGVVDLTGLAVLVPAPVGWARAPIAAARLAWRIPS